MRQLFQDLRSGAITLLDAPAPAARPGWIVIRSEATLISAGTERMLLEFGRGGWLAKARQQPEKVRQVLEKLRTDGLLPTIDAVKAKLDVPFPMGYSNAGVVVDVGSGVDDLALGDRVISNGPHAEFVTAPRNLCAKIPDGVRADQACFTVVGSIALQGVRLASPTIGETVTVTGCGLIGLLAIQILRANGCRVLGVDVDAQRLELAAEYGATPLFAGRGEDPVAMAREVTGGRGVDAVLVTAVTDSSEPIAQAARMCRARGRIVLVGVTGLTLSRADFYEKELSFQVSCSYGPGRYDPEYEEGGHDYPLGHVRWTENRNFEAVLDLMATGALNVTSLISKRFPFEQAPAAYEALLEKGRTLGIVMEYDVAEDSSGIPDSTWRPSTRVPPQGTGGRPRVGVIGAGDYARRTLIPAVAKTGVALCVVADRGGQGAGHAARRFGFQQSTTDLDRVFDERLADAVFIATRHNSHAALAARALDAGMDVFVEKPLAIDPEGLEQVQLAYRRAVQRGSTPVVMVGFNRRFAPMALQLRSLLDSARQRKSITMTINAGAMPAGHWTVDPAIGGGRIVGEACHFVDLARFLVGHPISKVWASPAGGTDHDPGASLFLTFADESNATIHYFTDGSRLVPKERLEVFCAGRVLQLDNWRRVTGFGWPGFRAKRSFRQDKGNAACVRAFVAAVRAAGDQPIPMEEVFEVSEAVLRLTGAVRGGGPLRTSALEP